MFDSIHVNQLSEFVTHKWSLFISNDRYSKSWIKLLNCMCFQTNSSYIDIKLLRRRIFCTRIDILRICLDLRYKDKRNPVNFEKCHWTWESASYLGNLTFVSFKVLSFSENILYLVQKMTLIGYKLLACTLFN